MMSRRRHTRWSQMGAIILHLVFIWLAYHLAFLVRFDFQVPPHYQVLFLKTLPVMLVVRFATSWAFRLYRSSWRHSGVADMKALFNAVTLSSLLFATVLLLAGELRGFPRSVLLADWAAAMLLWGGVRFAVRMLEDQPLSFSFSRAARDWTPAIIVGGGDAGARLVRELRMDRVARVMPVAIIDD